MKLTTEQLEQYEEQGFLLIPACFSQEEVAVVRDYIPALMTDDSVVKAWEEDNKTLRAIVGLHINNEFFRSLVRHPRLLEPARQLCGSDLYLSRSKIGMKKAFSGGMWQWHQDAAYSQKLDNSPPPLGVITFVFLDEVNEFNGPIYFIPGSHKEGLLNHETNANANRVVNEKSGLEVNYSSIMSYTIMSYTAPNTTISRIVENRGIVAPKGVAGSVLFCHFLTMHGSAHNLSPFNRDMLGIIYKDINSISPLKFRGSQDCTPLQTLSKKEVDHLFCANLATTPIS
ncbi:phytanoyl-CoA dioxygenase family protein [Coleofasciculus sp.]|uniref:phytanoyl-CoA dioxygenase family protein n=1 Tax=Coleofasciculus sp. TaxID=3100458 RepID=UPI0039F942A0